MQFPTDWNGTEGNGAAIRQRFLEKLERTPNNQKRLKILKACSRLRAGWVEHLFWTILSDSCEEIRDFLVRDLSIRDTIDLGFALAKLEHPPWYAKSAVLKVLGARRIREAVPFIERATRDVNVDVRCSAALALGDIGGEQALKLLVKLKRDENLYVRAAAEESISKASRIRIT